FFLLAVGDRFGIGSTIKITADDAAIVSADATDDRQNNDGAVSIDSQDDDETHAFKSQFDEISNILRMLENAKTNNNNRYHGSPGRVHPGFSSPNYLLPQRRVNVRSHHRSFSHPNLPTTRNTPQNKRSHGSFYPGHHRLASLPYTGVPYPGFGQDEDLPLNFDDPLSDDSSYARFGFKSESDWDISSPMSSTPGYPSSPSSIDP
ncbi:14050_t:CDS:2, partial [Cetraspora pellucida]